MGAPTTSNRADEQAAAPERIAELVEAAGMDRDRLRKVLDVLPEGVMLTDTGRRVIVRNRAAERIAGPLPDRLDPVDPRVVGVGGGPSARGIDPGSLPVARALSGELVRGEQLLIRHPLTGERRPLLVNAAPLRDPSGAVVGAVTVFQEISDLKRVEQELRAALRDRDLALREAETQGDRVRFLLEANTVLGASLDFDESLHRLAALAVRGGLGELCLIDILERDGAVRRMAAAHADPRLQPAADLLRERYAPRPGTGEPTMQAATAARSVFLPEVDEGFIRRVAHSVEHAQIMRRLGFASLVCLPLEARGRVLGAVTLVRSQRRARFTEEELEMAEDLARRAALAVDNARLYGERAHVARTLQESLLPRELPLIPGVEIAARYHAAGEGNEVGGDFYDLFDSGGGAFGVVIGDVCGKGAEAAAVTGQARYTLRAAAIRQHRPSRILEVLNEALLAQRTDTRFCTVAYVRVRPTDAGVRATVSLGGHPGPVVLWADGTVEQVGRSGTLLGVFPQPELSDQVVDLRPGDALVLCTDGVLGARAGGRAFDERDLAEVLRPSAGRGAADIAEAVEDAVLAFQGGLLRDDAAILVLRVRPED